MGELRVKNLYGADIELIGKCGICNEEFTYRLKERKVCQKEACFKESIKRRERTNDFRK